MASSSTTTTATNNQTNPSTTESAIYEYMRQFVDYQENGVNLNELSQIRQLDIYLQSIFLLHPYVARLLSSLDCYNRVRELVTDLREKQEQSVRSTCIHFRTCLSSIFLSSNRHRKFKLYWSIHWFKRKPLAIKKCN